MASSDPSIPAPFDPVGARDERSPGDGSSWQDLVGRILGPDGPVARRLAAMSDPNGQAPVPGGYESRPEQMEMARRVMATMMARAGAAGGPRSSAGPGSSRLLVEAGTGVGKSFAYLVPAILRCVLHGEKVVVATATISLQEQLISKDIPLLVETLKDWGLPDSAVELKPVLAKGRGNYVSIRRLRLASQRQDSLMPEAEQRRSLHVIEDWAYSTQDGSLSTLPALERPEVWEHARSDSDNCMGRKCAHYQDCFYQNARRAIEQANLIVCNHALFFADLSLRAQGVAAKGGGSSAAGGAVLPNYQHVVFDEAHNLEDAAASYFGLTVSEPRVRRLLRTLYSPRRRKGYLSERSLSIADAASVDRAIMLVIRAEDAARTFFDQLLAFARSGRSPSGRLRRADADDIDNTLTPVMRDLAVRLRLLREGVKTEADRFELSSLARRAAEIGDACEALLAQSLGIPKRNDDQGGPSDENPDGPRFVSDEEEASHAALRAGAGEMDESEESVREALSPYVYWVEVERDPLSAGAVAGLGAGLAAGGGAGTGRFGPRVTLSCAPVDVAPILRRTLFDPGARLSSLGMDVGGDGEEADAPAPEAGSTFRPSIVLTSATLATRTAGADEHAERAEAAFSHVMNALGLPPPPETRTLQLGSPFDYARQVEMYLDLTMPSPRSVENTGGGERDGTGGLGSYARALADRIEHHVRATDGGAFVLFTSFVTLNAVAGALRERFARTGWPLVCQGADGSRAAVLAKFLESERSVLFGAASFWQGVDVRGERLRNVIITRLPFEPPDRPITQARLERLEALGQNPFTQDSLPRAIIRFKQGFGRLIRSRSDRGRVVVLDSRVATTSYGRAFLSALPPGVIVRRIQHGADAVD